VKTSIPVNPDVLKWARSSLSLSRKDVAAKLHKTESEIEAWENGLSTPSYAQLENLAYHIYKRPVAVFFFPEVPEEDSPKADFRSLPESIISELPSEIVKLYRKAKVYQINLSELFEQNQLVENQIINKFEFLYSTDIQNLALEIRHTLNIDVDMQIRWSNHDEALKKWRQRFEENGVFVFKDAFQNDDYSGFCLFDNKFPLIFLNNSLPKTRQIFTLFHELAHLLFKSGGIDIQDKGFFRKLSGDYSKLEMKCNEFAGEMLLPSKYFQKESLNVDEKTISQLASKYKVSREVILRKYLNFGLINEMQYRSWADQWIHEAQDMRDNRSSGGDYYHTQKAYLGETYINLVFGKYFKKQITTEKLADYLGMSVRNISTFENYVLA
jgi:Zn-dependent peptidase ImmA (M78 family)/DNA-binding XRE family transcriptional regulator